MTRSKSLDDAYAELEAPRSGRKGRTLRFGEHLSERIIDEDD